MNATTTTSSVGVGTKASLKEFKQRLSQAKDYEAFADVVLRGEDVFEEVQRVLAGRTNHRISSSSSSYSLNVQQRGVGLSSRCAPPPPPRMDCGSHHAAALDGPREAAESQELGTSTVAPNDRDRRVAVVAV